MASHELHEPHGAHGSHGAHGPHELHDPDRWIDTYWWLLVIAFGVVCVLALDFWHPLSGS
jgi:hypothetical protein